MNNNKNKEKLRKKYMRKRKKVCQSHGSKKSAQIKIKLLKMENIKKASDILVYISYNSEVQTDNIINDLLKLNKNIYAPYCIVSEKRMEIASISDLNNDLEKGAYGIPEPKQKLKEKSYTLEKLDVVIVPAVAFSEKGYRIGYGGGYYDRFLQRLNNVITIGITYDELLFETLPKEEHDKSVDFVVTDKRIKKCK